MRVWLNRVICDFNSVGNDELNSSSTINGLGATGPAANMDVTNTAAIAGA